MRLLSTIAFALLSSSLFGCSNYAIQRYAVSAGNVSALRSLRGQWINVGAFSAADDETSIMCRGEAPINTADGETFAQYVRNALIAELEMAEVFAATAPITLTGKLDGVDFSSFSGEWDVSLTLTSSNGKSLHVDEKYGFSPSYNGQAACAQTAQAFMPGVQDLIAKAVHDPTFPSLVSAPGPPAATAAAPVPSATPPNGAIPTG